MATEIKRAFELFKKELSKETGIKGGFTMNARQIENRTATWAVCRADSYETTISYFEDWKNKTDNEQIKAECERRIEYFKAERNEYGTIEHYVNTRIELMTGSKAFKKFREAVGNVEYHTEINNDYCGAAWVYVRFNY